MSVFYHIAKNVTRLVSHLFYKVSYEGIEKVPTDRGFILCSNHITMFDPILVACRLKRQCFFMAKEELFRNKFVSLIIRGLGAFPVSRGKGDTEALDKAVNYVKDGKVVAIFPEGTRSKDGHLQKLKSGAVVIAAQTGGGLQPCVVKMGEKKLFRRPVVIRYGDFITHEQLGLEGKVPSQIRSANKLLTTSLQTMLDDIQV
jgi:1-acyl-sn-glycerol-3-phosphate acyltransferase